MELNDLLVRYGEKIGEILSGEDLLDKYSPWNKNDVDNLVEHFKLALDTNSKDFSWLNIEKELLDLKKDSKPNIHFGIPNHVHGDIDNGTFFLCMINPNIDIKDSIVRSVDGLQTYFNREEVVLSKDSSLHVQKQDESELKKFVEQHIVNIDKTGSILFNELNFIKEGKRDIENKEIGFEEDDAYYLKYYFNLVCAIFIDKNIVKDKKSSEFKVLKKFEDLKNILSEEEWNSLIKMAESVVNLEAFPFRSQNPGFTRTKPTSFAKEIVASQTRVGMLSSRIIIWRICRYLKKQDSVKPIFIFRKFKTAWLPSLQNVLMNDLEYPEKEAEDLLTLLYGKFFYTIEKHDFFGQGGNKLLTAPKNKKNEKILKSHIYKQERHKDDLKDVIIKEEDFYDIVKSSLKKE